MFVPFSRSRDPKIVIFPLRRRANHWHWSAQPAPPRGTLRGRHETWRGLRWTLWRQAGSLAGRNVCSVRRSRVVLAPRPWRLSFPARAGEGNGDNKRRSPGRARISRKAIAWGKPGCLGCTCGVCPCASHMGCPCAPAHGIYGRSQCPAFPAPSLGERDNEIAKLKRKSRCENEDACLSISLRATCPP